MKEKSYSLVKTGLVRPSRDEAQCSVYKLQTVDRQNKTAAGIAG